MSFLLDRFLLGARGPWRERAAVVSEHSITTYAELADRIEALAGELREHGFRRGDAAITSLETGESVAVSMFAIWRLGGVCVPISPLLPSSRAEAILDGVSPRVVITGAMAGEAAGEVVVSARTGAAPCVVAGSASRRPRSAVAYVVHTSGSTGRPKGVVVTHDNLTTLAENHESAVYARFAPPLTRVSLNNPPETDASFSELVQLAYGRTLHAIPPTVRSNPGRMAELLARHDLEVLDATPSQLRGLLLAGHRDRLEDLRLLMVGGEEIDEGLWAELAGLRPTVVNVYGPSECTVDVTFAEVTPHTAPHLGREFPGTSIRILGSDGVELPDGEVGEICVSGAQVAAGYLAASGAGVGGFFADVDAAGRFTRSYRTGDRGRRLASGEIAFAGRVDDQVKVRGHRIELGDVEHALRDHPDVTWACAVVDQTGLGSTLRAFVILSEGTRLDAVAEHVAARVPRAVVPTLHELDEVPVAASGKVDRARLLEHLRDEPQNPPALAPETVVLEVWRRHVGVEVVRDDDDFFSSGGNSIAAAMLTVELRDRLSPGLAIDVLYGYPTLREYTRQVIAMMSVP